MNDIPFDLMSWESAPAGFIFGIPQPNKALAYGLRQLADKIESGDAVVVKVTSGVTQSSSDFATASVSIEYALKAPE